MSNTSLVIDQKAMKEHFIVTRYVHGSGGHFLNAWLTSAKLNRPVLQFGKNGSGHLAEKEFHIYKNPKYLPEPNYEVTTPPPYFTYTEYRSLPIISSMFYKVINISYDLDDCDEIELCFIGKYYLERPENIISNKYCRQHTYRQKYYSPVESTDNILNVSWKEYLHGDAYALCEKLKIFTGLENIKIEPLLEWREKTKICMNNTITQVQIHEDMVEL